jgi:uncharacterized protein YoxC
MTKAQLQDAYNMELKPLAGYNPNIHGARTGKDNSAKLDKVIEAIDKLVGTVVARVDLQADYTRQLVQKNHIQTVECLTSLDKSVQKSYAAHNEMVDAVNGMSDAVHGLNSKLVEAPEQLIRENEKLRRQVEIQELELQQKDDTIAMLQKQMEELRKLLK